ALRSPEESGRRDGSISQREFPREREPQGRARERCHGHPGGQHTTRRRGEENPHGTMSNYDGAVESLLTALQRSRARGAPKRFHPIFLFSKFDSVNREALRRAKIEDAPPSVRETTRRAAYARALLDTNLPKTIAKITDREVRGVRFATPSYFFSRVATEAATRDRREGVRLRRGEDGGWELDYSAGEYVALLERLRTIATEAGD